MFIIENEDTSPLSRSPQSHSTNKKGCTKPGSLGRLMGALTDCLERALRDRQGFVKNSLDVIPQTNKEDNQEHYYKNKRKKLFVGTSPYELFVIRRDQSLRIICYS